MLADELDYVVGVDTHRDEHVPAVVASPAGAVVARARAVPATRAGIAQALAVRRRLRGRQRASGRSRTRQLWRRAAGSCGRGESVLEAAARQRASGDSPARRPPRRGPDCPCGARERDARAAAGATARGAAAAAGRPSQRGRRPRAGARAVARRDRDRSRAASRGVARLPVGKLLDRCSRPRRATTARRARNPARAAQPRATRPGSDTWKRPSSSAILGHVRALAPRCSTSRRRPDRRRATARCLVTPRPLRSEAAFARLAGVAPLPPRAARRSATASAAAATANSFAPCTPSSCTAANTTQQPRTTSPRASPKAKPPRRHAPTQALPRPPPLPPTQQPEPLMT